MTRLAAIIALSLAAPAHATTAPTWSGPGPYACNAADTLETASPCTMAWALTTLTPQQRRDVLEAARIAPDGHYLPIHDGDYLPLMAYARDGVAVMDRRGTVAVLDMPSPAYGWRVSGGEFVRIVACGNWSWNAGGGTGRTVAYVAPVAVASASAASSAVAYAGGGFLGGGWSGGGGTWRPPVVVLPPVVPPVPPGVEPPVEPSPVSLAGSGWMLLAGLAGLWMRRRAV